MCQQDEHHFQQFDADAIFCLKCGMFKYKEEPVPVYPQPSTLPQPYPSPYTFPNIPNQWTYTDSKTHIFNNDIPGFTIKY